MIGMALRVWALGLCGLLLAGCVGAAVDRFDPGLDEGSFAPEYLGVETHLLDGDLVNFQVQMRGARSKADVERYAECAAAQYALIRGFGFARHVRTNVVEQGGLWTADAVYTISSALPDGVSKLDAEVVVEDCIESDVPTV